MTEKLVRLRAPQGATDITHGPQMFPVRDGVVDVPEYVASYACDGPGGFHRIGPTPTEIVVELPDSEFVEKVNAALKETGVASATPQSVARIIVAMAHAK